MPLQTDGSTTYGSRIGATPTTAVVGHRGYGSFLRATLFEKTGSDWQRLQVLAAGPYPMSSAQAPVAIDADTIMVGGGSGTLCVGGQIGRCTPRNAMPFGTASFPVDLTALPNSTTGPSAALPGERYYFQA